MDHPVFPGGDGSGNRAGPADKFDVRTRTDPTLAVSAKRMHPAGAAQVHTSRDGVIEERGEAGWSGR
jgi:hypothetical protein